MATDTAIVIAWRDMGCPHRMAAFEYVLDYWDECLPEIPIVVGDAEPFSRAAGINAGIRKAWADYGAEFIFQPDPDTIIGPSAAREAIGMARWSPGVVNPYDRYLYLEEGHSKHIILGDADYRGFGPDHCTDHGPFGTGLAAAYSRETWERAGCFDENFGVWAGDDAAFAYAAAMLVAPGRRVQGDAWHLWHPRHPDSFPGTPGYVEQWAILEPYRDAVSPEMMMRVIAGR